MSAHDEAVEAAVETWLSTSTASGRDGIVAAITAYRRHLRAAGFVVAKVPENGVPPGNLWEIRDLMNWLDGWNACRAAMLASVEEIGE